MNAHLLYLLIMLLSLLIASICSTVHQSLRSLSRSRLDDLAEKATAQASRERLDTILDDRTGHAASVALPQVLCIAVFLIATAQYAIAFDQDRDAFTTAEWTVRTMIGGLIGSVLAWLFAVTIPLSIATHAGERIVLAFAGPIRLMHTLTMPVQKLVDGIDETVRRLAGAELRNGHDAQAEILSVVEESEAEGQLDEAEREMIEGVVGFRTTTVERIMTPRTEIEAIELTDDLAAVQQRVIEIGHSRIPVYNESLDDIVGILYAKDLLHWLSGPEHHDGDGFHLESLVRPALFVPEQKTVRELLAELVAEKVHLTMVADEYGGTSGLVTIEDIIEEVFGDIFDEYEIEEEGEPKTELDLVHGSATADAGVHVDDLNGDLERLDIEIPESDDYDTLGGYVVTSLGRIPDAGETIDLDTAVLTILEAAPTRVLRVRIERRDTAPPAAVDETAAAD
ncbi:MAG: hemolysin family protein [Planctomycetota bacterium]